MYTYTLMCVYLLCTHATAGVHIYEASIQHITDLCATAQAAAAAVRRDATVCVGSLKFARASVGRLLHFHISLNHIVLLFLKENNFIT